MVGIINMNFKYRKKPLIIDAIQWNDNFNEIVFNFVGIKCGQLANNNLVIETLEGLMEVKPGDYIIKGIAGEFYPCKKDIFETSYEKVEE